MPMNMLTNKLLYVPFNHEYEVDREIREKLTEHEFFAHCYHNPDFDAEICVIHSINDEELADHDDPLSKREMIERLSKCKNDRDNFTDWIANSNSGIYSISGDAGTGKSTYLHYLKYITKNIDFEIVDVQRAANQKMVFQYSIYFARFEMLHQKVLSAIVDNIVRKLFPKPMSVKIDVIESYGNIVLLCDAYKKHVMEYHPSERAARLYHQLLSVKRVPDKLHFCQECARIICNYFSDAIREANIATADGRRENLFLLLEIYLIALRCFQHEKKTIIAFDNIERFIGTDEVFNGEVVELASSIRAFHDAYREAYTVQNIDHFSEAFQFLILIRNTSIRMFTTQQTSDFLPHVLNISEWFSIHKIIEMKVKWYHEHNIRIEKYDDVLYALNDSGFSGDAVRGLRPRLDMLFNYNKRLATEMLICVFSNQVYTAWLEIARSFRDNIYQITGGCAKFAYRSIIMRLVLEELKQDKLFKHLRMQASDTESERCLSYTRKILTILQNRSLRSPNEYVAINELIRELYGNVDNAALQFYNMNNAIERTKVCEILYYMNYYARRNGNWLQLIDIQYNVNNSTRVCIKDAQELKKIIEETQAENSIRIKIMDAGKAFLFYVLQTFEFYSCQHMDEQPLLCTIPEPEEIEGVAAEKQKCVKLIAKVVEATEKSLKALQEEEKQEDFSIKKTYKDGGIPPSQRLIHAHIGYIDNFINCLQRVRAGGNEDGLNKIVSQINSVKDSYKKYQQK